VMLAVADLLARKGDLPGAVAQANAATAADASSAIAWLNLGVYLGTSGDIAGAERAFAKAQELAPEWPKACSNRGLALETLQRPGDAGDVYEACLARISAVDVDGRKPLERALSRARATQSVAPR
jgi:Flp pilus assembly protein TadD